MGPMLVEIFNMSNTRLRFRVQPTTFMHRQFTMCHVELVQQPKSIADWWNTWIGCLGCNDVNDFIPMVQSKFEVCSYDWRNTYLY